MILALLTATALAGGLETWTAPTAEGQTLVVSKKGRAIFKMSIEGGDKSEEVKCATFVNIQRTPLAMQLRVAGERSTSGVQTGTVVSYADGLATVYASGAGYMPGLCAIGVDALSGLVVVTLGGTFKSNGRTATLSAEKATELGAWLAAVK